MKKRISTLAIIAVFAVSVVSTAGFVAAQTPTDPFIRVAWQVADDVRQFDNSAEHSEWIFGPQPKVWVGYADNLTHIADNSYLVNVGTDLLINITVPKIFLGEGNELEAVQFWGVKEGPRAPYFGLEYNVTSDRWNSMAFRYIGVAEEPVAANFITLDSLSCEYSEETDYYRVVFAITYELMIVPAIMWTGMQTIDTMNRPASPSWISALEGGGFITPPIGLSKPVDPRDFQLPNYYYADIINPQGAVTHFVDVGDTFTVRMMSPAQFGDVFIPFTQLTFNESLKITANWTFPEGLQDSDSVLFNKDVAWVKQEVELYPFMFLKYNSTDIYALAGYLDVNWTWVDLGGGVGLWFPLLNCVENSTISMADYFVANSTYMGVYDGGHRLQWSGYFTDLVDLDQGLFKGGTIEPELSLSMVLDINGRPITARPDVEDKQTMKLAFQKGFIEAFVFNDSGQIADVAQQGDNLNLTMIVHAPREEINGSFVFQQGEPTGDFNLTRELSDLTIDVMGTQVDGNDTHYWRVDIVHSMQIDFKTGLVSTQSTYTLSMFLRGGGLLWSIPIPANHVAVSGYEIEIGESLTTLKVQFSFVPGGWPVGAPDMIIDSARVQVGVIDNLRIWDATNGTWGYPWWLNGTILSVENYTKLVDAWTDTYNQADISTDIFWSPRHLILGDIPVYKPEIWTITEDGAIDLDGNVYTTNDQYFVKRTAYWREWGNWSIDGMWVGVGFDPSPGRMGDEFWSENWMGVVQLNLWYEANETFYWYHADDWTPVNAAEMADIQDTVWADNSMTQAKPGYLYVAWMTLNRTVDLSSITGLEQNHWKTTWFAWGTTQNFWVSITENQKTLAHFQAEYAGLLIFNDGLGPTPAAPDFSFENGQLKTDEVTHVVLIDDIGSIELRRPFGSIDDSGDIRVTADTVIDFGVTIRDVDVTIYPLRVEHSDSLRGPWAFRESYDGAIGLNSTSFDYWITPATIDVMSFDVTFSVDMVEYDAEDPQTWNHAVSFKIDQTIGNWTLHDFGNSVLAGRSLAVNYFGILATGTATRYTAGERPVTDTNQDSQGADYYRFGSEDSPFANVSMGGLPYLWGGDGYSTTYYSGSSTAPLGAFSVMFESESGMSVTNWNIQASMLFMTAGYENWGGHDLIVDPVFVSYSSAFLSAEGNGTTTTPPPSTTPPPPQPPDGISPLYIMVGAMVVMLVLVLVMARRR
ncbi:MAG: hypothetical protein ACFFFC_05220 [Candidatus Thorarchaeota archaeon]